MRGTAGSSDDHLEPSPLGAATPLEGELRCAMRTDYPLLIRDSELIQRLRAMLHHIPIRATSHDNSDEWLHNQ
jgi:hypothetical protein